MFPIFCFQSARWPPPTKAQLTEFREAFNMFDINKTGSVTTKELGDVLRNMGQEPSETELRHMVDEVDEDGSGSIEFEEFVEMMMNKIHETELDVELREAFTIFDKNGDGFIGPRELKEVMAMMGERLTEVEVEAMIREADKDGDGKVNYKEFYAMVMMDPA
ncbi:calmodulin-beta-like [Ylistrum balloti]|uniref:calmodulin-beta-like n=1 Tax=Ylistrum balloti TaxID=509963 RepID=UPI00290588A6|nr:calmodulin-beta-like [Ylistrum balloti]